MKKKDAKDPLSSPSARDKFIKSEPRCRVSSVELSGRSWGATMKQSDISNPLEKANIIATDIEYRSLLTYGRSVLEDLANMKSGKKINLAADDTKRSRGCLWMD